MKLILSLIAGLCISTAAHAQTGALRAHGVLIHVTDLDRAVAFYRDVIGFPVEARRGAFVKLDASTPLYLEQVPASAPAVYGKTARAGVTLLARDLAETIATLERRDVEFVTREPKRVGVGYAAKFVDPFGNVVSLLEQTIQTPTPFEEPFVYNYGFTFGDMAAARAFFADGLGFIVRSEEYLPPALPLGHDDGSFAFMLHYREGLAPIAPARNQFGGAVVIFEAENIDAATELVAAHNARLFTPAAEQTPFGERIVFAGPEGVAAEIWSLDHE